jgi:hypothetical protein
MNGSMREVYEQKLPMPITNLEFWIGQNVDDVDFSSYHMQIGLMGGDAYYGTGYVPLPDKYGKPRIPPEHYVVYTVTSYPDYSSRTKHITQIGIVDPSIQLYGISINSSKDEINTAMLNNGFTEKEKTNSTVTYVNGKYSITFSDKYISLYVMVTNEHNIEF